VSVSQWHREWFVQFIAHLFYQLNQWKIAVLVALTFGSALVPVALIALNRDPGKEKRLIAWGLGCTFGIGFPLIFGFAFLGSAIATSLVHRYGVDGEGVVTGRFDTGAMYNDEPVQGYRVLVRTRGDRTVQTGFRSDTFNVYPPENGVAYPLPGVRFTARYLPDYPEDFVIIADDESPWAHSLRCSRIEGRARELTVKLQFSATDPTYRREYDETLAAVRAARCNVVSTD